METTYAPEFPSDRNSTGWMRWQEFPTEADAADAGEEMGLGEFRIVEINRSEHVNG